MINSAKELLERSHDERIRANDFKTRLAKEAARLHGILTNGQVDEEKREATQARFDEMNAENKRLAAVLAVRDLIADQVKREALIGSDIDEPIFILMGTESYVVVDDLAAIFGKSETTIRKSLDRLEETGLIIDTDDRPKRYMTA